MVDNDSLQERITEFWSTIAAGYEAHEGNVPTSEAEYKAWVEALRGLLPAAPADVLDVGTGTGFPALIASLLGHRVVGIDLSEQMLIEARAKAHKQGLTVLFERRDAVKPGFTPMTFDAILARHLIWTLRDPQTAFRNWRQLLRPEGRVVAIDGHWFREEQPLADAGGASLFERHYTPHTRSALPLMLATSPEPALALFRKAGFTSVELSYLSQVHAQARHPPSDVPWFVVVARP